MYKILFETIDKNKIKINILLIYKFKSNSMTKVRVSPVRLLLKYHCTQTVKSHPESCNSCSNFDKWVYAALCKLLQATLSKNKKHMMEKNLVFCNQNVNTSHVRHFGPV